MPYIERRVSQAEWLLRAAFVIVPIVTGADKIAPMLGGSHVLSDWQGFLAPAVERALPIAPHLFMYAVGAIEIIAGLIVLFKPRLGGLLVSGYSRSPVTRCSRPSTTTSRCAISGSPWRPSAWPG